MRPINQKTVAEARRLRRTGMPMRAIALKLKVSDKSIRNYCAGVVPGQVGDDDLGPPLAAPDVADDDQELRREVDAMLATDPRERVVRAIARNMRRAKEAERIGNTSAVAKYETEHTKLSMQLTQLEKKMTTDADVWTAPRSDIERAERQMRENLSAMVADIDRCGLACPHCGRAIRTRLARGDDPPPEPA
jgi:hypothetical protein